ncbi:hypothetical protein [Bacillus halotolerans]|uniref:hypothetical protein n=1 Tax=Bacillus halotolerans TaxID=260554 RepID=UPI003F6BF091
MVIVIGSYDFPVGHVDTVKEVDSDHLDGSVYLVEGENGETYLDGTEEDYRVLVPVESAEADEPQPADLIDVVSSLATRVADLERENKKLHSALDEDMKIRSENTRRYLALKDEIDTLHKDNRTIGEEVQKVKQDLRETMDDVSCMYEEIKQAESNINEMSFAVEDLAEALKKTDPVYGERIFTAEEVVALMTALKVRP